MYDYVRDSKDSYNERIKNVIQGEKIKKEKFMRCNMEVEKKKALLFNVVNQHHGSIIRNVSANPKQVQFEEVDKSKSRRLNFARKRTLGSKFLR